MLGKANEINLIIKNLIKWIGLIWRCLLSYLYFLLFYAIFTLRLPYLLSVGVVYFYYFAHLVSFGEGRRKGNLFFYFGYEQPRMKIDHEAGDK